MTTLNNGKDRLYTGEAVDIMYNTGRCIHAEYCVKLLSQVFDKQKRPWVDANGAPAETIASVIERCPSGALHYTRKDGLKEAIPDSNNLVVSHNGPLEIRGNLDIHGTIVELKDETRVTLCRCGGSGNKPFCDNTHLTIKFEAVETEAVTTQVEPSGADKLRIAVHKNGPLELQGAVTIVNADGALLFSGEYVELCRCRGSKNKPFCDGTHEQNGFTAE